MSEMIGNLSSEYPPSENPSVRGPGRGPRRPRRMMAMLLRRGHLYTGLFLFPWAILYGVTAFLFNHPTVASDQPVASFDHSTLVGTPLATLPDPTTQAAQLVELVNQTQSLAEPLSLAGAARYGTRDFAFATVKSAGPTPGESTTVSLLFDLDAQSGAIRSTRDLPKPELATAPFAVTPKRTPPRPTQAEEPLVGGLMPPEPLAETIRASIPSLLERTGFPNGTITVTSVPDLIFPVRSGGQIWTATYQPMTGSLTGQPGADLPPNPLSTRRFLLRLHTAHGYPSYTNARWFWAVIVDAMAFALAFWGLTGLVMWWQLKSTRRLGAVALMVGLASAMLLGLAMHSAITAK